MSNFEKMPKKSSKPVDLKKLDPKRARVRK